MSEQTKHCILPEEFWDDMRWTQASIARSWIELEEIHELSKEVWEGLEAVIGRLPQQQRRP